MDRIASNLIGTYTTSFRIGAKGAQATITASALSTNRTYTLVNYAGYIALGPSTAGVDSLYSLAGVTTTAKLPYLTATSTWGTAAWSALATSGDLLKLTAQAATDIPLSIVAHASQSANLFEVRTSGGGVRAKINAAGSFSHGGPGSGSLNEVFGVNAGIALTTGVANTFFGNAAGTAVQSGNNNVGAGYRAMYQASSASSGNTAIGTQAGDTITSGVSNVCIGLDSDTIASSSTNATAVGTGAISGSFGISIGGGTAVVEAFAFATNAGSVGFPTTVAGDVAFSMTSTNPNLVLCGVISSAVAKLGGLQSGVSSTTPTITGVVYDSTTQREAWQMTRSGTGSTSARMSMLQTLLSFCRAGRLTTQSGVPISTGSRTAQSTLYFTPFAGNATSIYDGTRWQAAPFSELSLSLSSLTSGANYDVFLWDNSGTLALKLGPAWTSDTGRGTGAGTTELVYVSGVLMNAVNISSGPNASRGVYLGTIRTTGTTTTEDGLTNRFVYNHYNKVPRILRASDNASVAGTNSTWVQYSTNSRIFLVNGDPNGAGSVFIQFQGTFHQYAYIGPGLDASGTPLTQIYNGGSFYTQNGDSYTNEPGLGYHLYRSMIYKDMMTLQNFTWGQLTALWNC